MDVHFGLWDCIRFSFLVSRGGYCRRLDLVERSHGAAVGVDPVLGVRGSCLANVPAGVRYRFGRGRLSNEMEVLASVVLGFLVVV